MSNEVSDVRHRRAMQNIWWYIAVAMAELCGTAILVFMGCSATVPGLTSSPPSHVQICLVFGFAVCIIIQMFGHVSGGHLNPAVTVAACIFKLIPITMTALYFVSQIVGAVLGYGLILLITSNEALYAPGSDMNKTHGVCATVPNPRITTLQAFLVEFFATAILIFVCCGVWDKRNALRHDSVPIKFGLAITGLALTLGPYSGASMNPARSFAPALYTGVWDAHWIYWIGPLSAGFVITYFYKFVFDREPPGAESDHSDVPLNQTNYNKRNSEKMSNEGLATA